VKLPHASSSALHLVLRYLFTAQLPGADVGWQTLMEACRWGPRRGRRGSASCLAFVAEAL
jgi:hypothetical protein